MTRWSNSAHYLFLLGNRAASNATRGRYTPPQTCRRIHINMYLIGRSSDYIFNLKDKYVLFIDFYYCDASLLTTGSLHFDHVSSASQVSYTWSKSVHPTDQGTFKSMDFVRITSMSMDNNDVHSYTSAHIIHGNIIDLLHCIELYWWVYKYICVWLWCTGSIRCLGEIRKILAEMPCWIHQQQSESRTGSIQITSRDDDA